MDGLIGCCGFVGGNLLGQHGFGAQFHSRNIAGSAGADFDTLVCAAAPGSMVMANSAPERDAALIDDLCQRLDQLRAERFVLISSIAVLEDFAGQCDEETDRFQQDLAYGRNRRRLEEFCQERFENCLVVRLPALFGAGLKKNFLFDILNPAPTMLRDDQMREALDSLPADLAAILQDIYRLDVDKGMHVLDRAALDATGQRARMEAALAENSLSAIEFTNPASEFQYYHLDRLWSDIETAREAGLGVLHTATQPLAASDIYRRLTGAAMPATAARLHREDMHTMHAALWGREGPYLEPAETVLARLEDFHRAARLAA